MTGRAYANSGRWILIRAFVLYWILVAFMDTPGTVFLERNLCTMLKEVLCIVFAMGPSLA
jgi:hypothetical protein